jgi:glucan biosynthesis protein C
MQDMNAKHSPAISRDHALDAARGTLMLLGLVLHAANVYSVDASWIISDPRRSMVFDWMAGLIHTFRMPAFFWVSGYFCSLTLLRYGRPEFLRKRLPRLLLPLFVSWATLNVAQLALLGAPVGIGTLLSFPASVPLYHLWFLIDLTIYFVVAAVFGLSLARLLSLAIARFALLRNPLVLVLFLAFGSESASVAVRLTGIAYENLLGVTSLYRLAWHFPYFLAGMTMFISAEGKAALLRISPLALLPATALALFAHAQASTSAALASEGWLLLEFAAVWVSIGATIALFHRLFPVGSRLSGFLSDASYTIYLCHHVVVFAFASVMLDWALPAGFKFTAVTVMAFVVCALVHLLLIRNSRTLRFAFNGK